MEQKQQDFQTLAIFIIGAALVIYVVFFDKTIIGAFILFALVWLYNNYEKIQYRRGKLPNELRFITSNDEFSKWTNYIIGGLLLMVTIMYYVWTWQIDQYSVCGLIGGLLIFLNGFLDLPKGILRVKENDLQIIDKANKLEEKLDWRYIKAIEIEAKQLIFTKHFEDKFRLKTLQIESESAQNIEAFFARTIGSDSLEVTNNFS